MKKKDMAEFAKDLNKLREAKGQSVDRSFFDRDAHKVISPEVKNIHDQAVMDVKRELAGKAPIEEKTIDYNEFKKKPKIVEVDTLDYSQWNKPKKAVQESVYDAGEMKKQYLKKAKEGAEGISRKGIKALSKGLKMVPVIGALAAGLGSEDASAAVPILGDAEAAGMSSEAEDQFIAEQKARNNYLKSPAAADRMAALEKLRKIK